MEVLNMDEAPMGAFAKLIQFLPSASNLIV